MCVCVCVSVCVFEKVTDNVSATNGGIVQQRKNDGSDSVNGLGLSPTRMVAKHPRVDFRVDS